MGRRQWKQLFERADDDDGHLPVEDPRERARADRQGRRMGLPIRFWRPFISSIVSASRAIITSVDLMIASAG